MFKCPLCGEQLENDDIDYFVHIYLLHPKINSEIHKCINGEKYMSFEELKEKKILNEKGFAL